MTVPARSSRAREDDLGSEPLLPGDMKHYSNWAEGLPQRSLATNDPSRAFPLNRDGLKGLSRPGTLLDRICYDYDAWEITGTLAQLVILWK